MNKLIFFTLFFVFLIIGVFGFWKIVLAKKNTTVDVGVVLNNSADKDSILSVEEIAIEVTPSIRVSVTPKPKAKEVPKKSDETNTTQTPDSTTTPTLSPTPAVTVDNCATKNLSAYDDLVLADSPVAYLPFDSDYYCDRGGNGLNGEKNGGVSLTTMPNNDRALTFDGLTGHIKVNDSDLLSIPTTGKMTIEAWMRPDALTFLNYEGTGYVHWLGKGETGNHEYHLRMYNLINDESRPNRISGYAFNPIGGLGVGSYFQDTVTAGDWLHVVFVYNTVDVDSTYPMGFTRIYKNGAQRDKDSLASLSIAPVNGTAPLRIGTRDLKSFFLGGIGKVAIYNYELSPYQILTHYQSMVPPTPGTASFVQNVSKFSTKLPGTKMNLSVQHPVTSGNTMIVRVLTDYTTGGPTVTDTKGNVYTRDRSSPNSATTMRASIFSAPVTVPLTTNDSIVVTSASVSARVAVVDEFSGLLSSGLFDLSNATSGNSTSPGSSISITPTQANELVIGFTSIEGPMEDTHTEDFLGQYKSLTREGTTGGDDATNLTINGGYKSVGDINTYSYRPTIDPPRNWIDFIVGYKAL